ncbi:hypothetical protein [Gluconobacter morbifer]|uniref:hypothetical protein n=1 Tax=Gluconobacter morbifer TaxID=479935 RepID=UPI001111C01E|nr:hypothetical protein [Gluconobacter morbifer]
MEVPSHVSCSLYEDATGIGQGGSHFCEDFVMPSGQITFDGLNDAQVAVIFDEKKSNEGRFSLVNITAINGPGFSPPFGYPRPSFPPPPQPPAPPGGTSLYNVTLGWSQPADFPVISQLFQKLSQVP